MNKELQCYYSVWNLVRKLKKKNFSSFDNFFIYHEIDSALKYCEDKDKNIDNKYIKKMSEISSLEEKTIDKLNNFESLNEREEKQLTHDIIINKTEFQKLLFYSLKSPLDKIRYYNSKSL